MGESMLKATALLGLASATLLAGVMTAPARAADAPPEWAYPVTPPDFKQPPDDGVPRRGPKRRRTHADDDRCRTAQRLRRLYERGEESVACCVLFAAAAALELVAHEPAERRQELAPACIADVRRK